MQQTPRQPTSWLRRVDVQLVAAFLVVALVPAAIIAGLLTWRSAQMADGFVSEHVQRTADAYAAGLDLFVERHRGRLRDLDGISLDADTLSASVRADRSLVALWLPDRDVSSASEPADWAREACATMRADGRSSMTHAGAGHAHEVVIAVERGGETMCAQIDFTVHQEMMSGQADSSLGGSAYIVDTQGVVVCHAFDESEPHVARGQVLSPTVGRVASAGRPWSGHVDEGGEASFGAFATASELPWGVWVQAPRAPAMAPFTSSVVQGVGLAALIALLAAGLAVWWARRIAAPIQELSAAAERLAAGERQVVVPEAGPSEIQALARRFNAMSQTVLSSRADLEARVEARTQALSRAHARLAQQEKMAAIGTLAAGLAHEIGNPLASMSSELEMLETMWDPADAQAAIPVLRQQIRRMSRLLRELVDIGRPTDHQVEEFPVAGLLDEVARLLRHDPRAAGVSVHVACPDGLRLVTSRDQLVQVIVNLGLNALDAVSEGGSVWLRAELEPDGERRLVVEDDGPGIPAELLSQVFDPFFTTKEQGRGTGLGLFVSDRIVRGLGAELQVAPSTAGTRFVVSFPADDEEGSA